MTANDNLDSRTARAQSQHDETEREELAKRRLNPQPNMAPTHNPALLPESYLQVRQPELFETPLEYKFGQQSNVPFPQNAQSVGNPAINRGLPNPAGTAAGPAQNAAFGTGAQFTGSNPAPGQGYSTPQSYPAAPAPESVDSTTASNYDSRSKDVPIDCTVQMRGRTRGSIQIETGIPWEKNPEPDEEEEKILPLPVPPPPPSSTNNRLPAMQMPVTSEELQQRVQQAASGSYNATKLDAIPTPRQAVRYKPASASNEPIMSAVPVPKMTEPAPQKKRRATAPPAEDVLATPPKTRINPKLLKPENESKPGDSFTPARSNTEHNFSWSEMKYLLTFYMREVKSLLINPHEFFLAHTADSTLGEPITFMILSGGIAAVFLALSGAIGDGLSTLFGTSAFAIIAAIAMHYAIQWLCVTDGDLKSTFKIAAYSQAPLLIAWIKLGSIPVGWLVAIAYSMYLCVVGLEQIFEIDRSRAMMIVIVCSLVIRGLLHLLGL